MILFDFFFNLKNDKKIDFRFIPILVVFLYFSALVYSEVFLNSYSILAKYFLTFPIPYFVDLKILLSGIDAYRDGANPYNTHIGLGYFNYPIVWTILSVFPFITVSNYLFIAFFITILFFVSIYFFMQKINLIESLIYTAILISPAAMLGIDRGNCDFVIFIILILSFNKNIIKFSILLLITSFLKLFPIGAIFAILAFKNEKKKRKYFIFSMVVFLFLGYCVAMYKNIEMVSNQTPRPWDLGSYGLGAVPSYLVQLTNNPYLLTKNQIFTCYIIFLILSFILFYFWLKPQFSNFKINFNTLGISYLIGAGIFLITCIIGYNYHYRISFLIFTLPLTLHYFKKSNKISFWLIFLTIICTWQSLPELILSRFLPFNLSHVILQLFIILLFFFHLSIILNFLTQFFLNGFFDSKISKLESIQVKKKVKGLFI